MSGWSLFCFLFVCVQGVGVFKICFHNIYRRRRTWRSWRWSIPNHSCPSPFKTSFVWSLMSTRWRKPWWSLRYYFLVSETEWLLAFFWTFLCLDLANVCLRLHKCISESCDNVWLDIRFFCQETEFCQLRSGRRHPWDKRNLDLDHDVHYN